jgi:hypothetical protein
VGTGSRKEKRVKTKDWSPVLIQSEPGSGPETRQRNEASGRFGPMPQSNMNGGVKVGPGEFLKFW